MFYAVEDGQAVLRNAIPEGEEKNPGFLGVSRLAIRK
jgi:hypothetical protein